MLPVERLDRVGATSKDLRYLDGLTPEEQDNVTQHLASLDDQGVREWLKAHHHVVKEEVDSSEKPAKPKP